MKDIKTESLWLMQGDCLERMKEIPDGSVNMVLADVPYGTTSCAWDSIIPLEKMLAIAARLNDIVAEMAARKELFKRDMYKQRKT